MICTIPTTEKLESVRRQGQEIFLISKQYRADRDSQSSRPCGAEVYCDRNLNLTRFLPVVSRSRMREDGSPFTNTSL